MTIEAMERVKQLRDIIKNDNPNEDEVRAYCIQINTLLPEPTKTLYIDADSLIYYAAYAPVSFSVDPIEGTFIGDNIISKIDELVKMFYNMVDDVVEACRIESLKGNMIRFKDYQLVFTPSTNFRYDIYPDYKCSRFDKEESEELKGLKSIVKPKGLIVEGVEADDVVAYCARRGNPIASGDKDVIHGVAGNNYFYHSKHKEVVKTSKEDAARFVLLQSIAGDAGDDIKGIKGVGLKTKLLPPNATFDDVINIYENHAKCYNCDSDVLIDKIDNKYTQDGNMDILGTCPKCKVKTTLTTYDMKDAILTRRLVGLDQWRGFRRNKVILFGDKANVTD